MVVYWKVDNVTQRDDEDLDPEKKTRRRFLPDFIACSIWNNAICRQP
jgi:hypothetical protein